ncbi:SMI1/KNR4 family protein [Desulfosporosinus meridiei]|uniref:Knr4/Smi1-like domain-containing protein n=1 Tax=Desulfosporosinus meridiei (strain ATCC BAA-275 / DSM 13257 / KCTC 12902 / NCIMB 13706 / S10) TaxID=768704 RepID=J7IUR2_DESMD|nr:SMI1/KNR4 family protein [Desulfosporosinus meridiei]AFQ43884.1 hypothetical protein Desmer_1930 [Desulfosporosinus meridiei DSM 13257]
MIKEELTFRIERFECSENEKYAFSKEFIRSLGLRVESGVWSTLNLSSPVSNDFITKSEELITNGIAKLIGILKQTIVEDEEDKVEWYKLISKNEFYFESVNEIITCKADRIPQNIHLASGFYYNQFVSEEFIKTVQEYDLKGLEWVWIKDIGRYKSKQWYLPVAMEAIGRGIDHPWWDPINIRGSHMLRPQQYRHGIWEFYKKEMHEFIRFDNSNQKGVLSLFNPKELEIRSYERFLSKFIPDADFAYIWRGKDQGWARWRGLYISKKAKDILLKHKLISQRDIEPIQILTEVPEGCDILDGKEDVPLPFYNLLELQEIKQKLAVEWNEYSLKSKPIKVIQIMDSIKLLRVSKKTRSEDFNKAITKSEIETLNALIPGYWIDVLKVSNGGFLNSECTYVNTRDLVEFNIETQKYLMNVNDDYPLTHLHFAHSPDGDWYSFDIRQTPMQDCIVHRISHETCHPIETWESISAFLNDMLTDYDIE